MRRCDLKVFNRLEEFDVLIIDEAQDILLDTYV